MHKTRTETAPAVFLPKVQIPTHPYPTNFSKINYIKSTSQLSRSKYRQCVKIVRIRSFSRPYFPAFELYFHEVRISVRGPALWNEFLTDRNMRIENLSFFKSIVKSKLLSYENEGIFF